MAASPWPLIRAEREALAADLAGLDDSQWRIQSLLGEAVIHGEDIRRPLGIHRDYPEDSVQRAATFYAGSNVLIGGKRRAAGLRLRATDGEWSIGNGPEVAGPGIALAMAICGRRAALADLSGDGVTTLASRMPADAPGG